MLCFLQNKRVLSLQFYMVQLITQKSELDIWAGYAFRDDLRMELGFMQTMEDDQDPDTTQVNATFTYSF